jgi:LPXTG-motif cell wall-anchored protein
MAHHFFPTSRRWISSVLLVSSVAVGSSAVSTGPVGASGSCTAAPASTETKVVFDNSFSSDGHTAINLDGTSGDTIRDIVAGPNGSAFLTYRTSNAPFGQHAQITKILSNGTPDASWGTNGIATINLRPGDSNNLREDPNDVIVNSDGSMIVLMRMQDQFGVDISLELVKLNSAGMRDNSYGTNGVASFAAASTASVSDNWGLTAGPSGSLYVGHTANRNHLIMKVDANGAPVNAFGTLSKISAGNPMYFESDSSGALYVVGQSLGTGSTFPQGNNVVEVKKYSSTGALDLSFGTDGVVQVNASPTTTEYHGVLTLNNNKLTGSVYAGTTNSSSSLIAVFRMGTSGVMDTTFGTNGIKAIASPWSLYHQNRPRIVVFPDDSTLLTSSAAPFSTGNAQFAALASNGETIADWFTIRAGDCNMVHAAVSATSPSIYAVTTHRPGGMNPDRSHMFKFSITGIPGAAPSTPSAPSAPSSPSTPSNTVAPTATATPVTPTALPAPALAVVRALPAASTPIVADTSISTGEKITVTFGGFRPFETVQLIVASTPRVIGSGTANAQGVVTLQGNLPANLSAGSHTLAVFAPTSGIGFTQKITVSPTTLPATGSQQQIILLTMALFLLGAGLVMRRTTKTSI